MPSRTIQTDHPIIVVRHIVEPKVRATVTEWADENRVLSRKFTAEPGPWRTDRTPYLQGIMDAFADPEVQRITFVKSARVGGSEAMNNCLLYALDRAPGPVLYVLPTEDDAKDEATGRLKNMIEDAEAIRPYIPYEGFASARQLNLAGPRTIYMAWAAAPRTLIRKTCRYVFFDELDNCEMMAGSLGNHLQVAAERVTTYGCDGKVVDATTPTRTDAAAWTEWLASDQRRFNVPCPQCGEYQPLFFSNIKWPEEERDPDAIEHDGLAWYECAHCKSRIEEKQRMWMVQRGCWIPASQKAREPLPLKRPSIVERAARMDRHKWTPALEGEKPRTRRIGFHIWSAYSPWRSFSMIAAEFLRTKDDPERYRVFINSWLGEPWTDTAVDVEVADLTKRRIDSHERDIVPDWVIHLGMSADTQTDHFVYEVRGWGPLRRSTLIREGYAETFEALYAIFLSQYQTLTKTSGKNFLTPVFLAIDSGGDRTKEVYEFCKTHPGALAIKGHGRVSAWYVRPSKIEYEVAGGMKSRSLRLFNINVDFYKDALFRMMGSDDPEDPGFWGLHKDTPEDYLRQVTAEHKIWVKKTRNGVPVREKVWALKASNRANHFLDATVYNMAIADHLGWLNLASADQKRNRSSRTVVRTPRDFLASAGRTAPRR